MSIANHFENGTVCTIAEILDAEKLKFNPHATFKGVSLKHLVTGKMTDNRISCHLVKVEPFCTLETHVHENNLEIHEVISGDGTCQIGDKTFSYGAGTVGVIPTNVSHKVKAGENGLYILAKFVPALI